MLKSVYPLLVIVLGTVLTGVAEAQTWGGLYDMSHMLKEPHPFDRSASKKLNSLPLAPLLQSSDYKSLPKKESSISLSKQTPKKNIKKEPRWNDILSEIRLGILLHDQGPFSNNEEEGFDGNLEILLFSPKALSFMSSPRPHFGVNYNSTGDTNFAYGGLHWEWSFWDKWFAGFSFGGMLHDGHLVGDKGGKLRKSLGCRALFREAVNFGYRFKKHHSVMLHLDHSSNASLCEKNTRDGTAEGRHDVVLNEGLESLGIRYGYKF